MIVYPNFRTLLVCGAPTDSVNVYGFTPLHNAVDVDSIDCTYLLLKNNADPNVVGCRRLKHVTPLHLANTREIVKILLRFEADPMLDSKSESIQNVNMAITNIRPIISSTSFHLALDPNFQMISYHRVGN